MKIAVAIISLLFSAATLACECLWQGPFKDVYTDADLVVYGEVERSQGNGFDLNIKEIIQGSDYREQIRIWGKKDNLCRPEAKDFPPGSQWIMALQRIDNPPEDAFNPFKANISFGRQDDFSLSSCGVYWLPVKEQRVCQTRPSLKLRDPKARRANYSTRRKCFYGKISATSFPSRSKKATSNSARCGQIFALA